MTGQETGTENQGVTEMVPVETAQTGTENQGVTETVPVETAQTEVPESESGDGDAGGTEDPKGPVVPEYIPRDVFETELEKEKRRLQSQKDKEIARLRKDLLGAEGVPGTTQPTPPKAAPQQETLESLTDDQFIELLNDGKGGIEKVLTLAEERAIRRIRREEEAKTREMSIMQQYANEMQGILTSGQFSDQERARAIQAADEAMSQGRPISPAEAAMIGRFGSVELGLRYAAQGMSMPGQPAPEVLPVPPSQAGQPGMIQAAFRRPPPVPGGGHGTVRTNPQDEQPQSRFQPGSYRKALL